MEAEEFRNYRVSLGVSQQKMAEMLGYKDKSIVCKYETGERIINLRLEKLIKSMMEKKDVSVS